MKPALYEKFRRIGHDCFLTGLVDSHSGNISVRVGDRLTITRRGSMLGNLRPADLTHTGVEDDGGMALASSEAVVHRAIYRLTAAQAILHTHPPHGVVLSLDRDKIVPLDAEGAYLLEQVPVVAAAAPLGSEETADLISRTLVGYKACMLRGHGLFAVGRELEEAFQRTTALESSARILYLAEVAGIRPVGHGTDPRH